MRHAVVLMLILVFPVFASAKAVDEPTAADLAIESPTADLYEDGCTIPTGCGAWPDDPTYISINPYVNKESATCKLIKVVDKETCEARCLCNHKERVDKCNGQRSCVFTQERDYQACLAYCMTDHP
jgi:hypothetical protein